MNLPEVESSSIYGEPYQTPDGATVITVARGSSRSGSSPMGVFVITDGKASWEPAIDATRIAFVGVLTGLVAAALATTPEQFENLIAERTHTRRLPTLQEMAEVATLMATDRASAIAGTIVNLSLGAIAD